MTINPLDQIKRAINKINPIAHPNRKGAKRYADMIISVIDGRGLSWLDNSHPTVQSFQVMPQSLTLGEPFTIDYTLSDTGGSGLKQVGLWRTQDEDKWPENPIQTNTLAGENGPLSGSFTDSPPSPGTYWYGVHVVDNAGNWNDERNSNTNYQPISFEPVGVVVREVAIAEAVPTELYSDLEIESIRKVREVVDAYISMTSVYGSYMSYNIIDTKSFDSKVDAARYMNDMGITYDGTQVALYIVDMYGLESTGFCIVIIEYNVEFFGEWLSILTCAICDEDGVPIGYEGFQQLMQGFA